MLDVRWITGDPDQAVADVIQSGANMLIPCGTSASLAVKRQATTIPIVFISVGNPTGIGLVESLSHPGGNATEFSDILADLGGKQIDLATELQRGRGPVDYFWHPGWADGKHRLQGAEDAAKSIGLTFRSRAIADIADLDDVIAGAKTAGALTLIIQPSPFTYQHRERIVAAAHKQQLPTIFAFPPAAREGALVAYGPDYVHMYRRAPFYVERILKGTKPADLPVEQPTKLELVVNLKTAKALGSKCRSLCSFARMSCRMKRREFITLLGGAAAWPLAARAQPTGKLPIIGFLGTNTASAQRQWTDAFLQRLRELGWIEGRTVAIEYRWADGRLERSAEIVAELVRLKVDVIVTHSAEAVLAAKRATAVIPIIFPVLGDPVGSGVVASLTRPDGNATGLSLQATDVAGKRVEILREVLPGFRRLGIVANIGAPAAVLEMREVQAAASTVGLATTTFEIRQTNDIATAIDALKDRVEALYVVSDPLVATNRNRLGILAVGAQLPTMVGFREHVEAGGLVSYGANFPALFRRGAEYVDKVLRGAKPADLPVEQPTKFDLVISLITAKALGLTIPPLLLARADEVIE